MDCPDAQISLKSRIKMSPNRQRLGFTFKGTDLSPTGGHTYCLSLCEVNKCEYECFIFQNNLLGGTYRRTRYEKGSWIYGLSKSPVN